MPPDRKRLPAGHAVVGGPAYRLLDDTDLLQIGDETCCLSTLLSGRERWHELGPDFADDLGKPVGRFDATHADMDGWERQFRRPVTPAG